MIPETQTEETRLNGRIDKLEDREELHWNEITKSLSILNTNIALLQMRDDQLIENMEKICKKLDQMYLRINNEIERELKIHKKICKRETKNEGPVDYLTDHPFKGSAIALLIIYILVAIIRDLLILI